MSNNSHSNTVDSQLLEITEFMAEGISIHDPNTQEVKPTSVTFGGLFISEWS